MSENLQQPNNCGAFGPPYTENVEKKLKEIASKQGWQKVEENEDEIKERIQKEFDGLCKIDVK